MFRPLTLTAALVASAACGGTSFATTTYALTTNSSLTAEAMIERAIDDFTDRRRGKTSKSIERDWQQIVEALTERIPDIDPNSGEASVRWSSIRALANQLGDAPKPAAKEGRGKKVKGDTDSEASVAGSTALAYRFGYRDFVAVDPKHDKTLAKQIKRGKEITLDTIPVDLRLRYLLNGCIPETGLALCAIEQQLDVHATYDDYARFLEDWRNTDKNGDESFYEALDRTAGTDDAVFFYDSMLSDFVQRFAKTEAKGWSLEEQHGKLHQAFLATRQYRGFVEAVAHSLALPASLSFPTRLARYDYDSVPGGMYSLRHQVDILIGRHGGDVAAVVDECRMFLGDNPPSPVIWDTYPLAARFVDHFQAEIPKIVAGGRSTDQIAAEVHDESARIADAVRYASMEVLGAE